MNTCRPASAAVYILSVLGTVLVMTGMGQARPTLTFAVSDSTSKVVVAYRRFMRQAYDRIGYDIRIKRFPTKRAYCHADLDKTDGLLISPASIMEKYKNLMMVPVALNRVDLAVYTITNLFRVEGFESLRPYKIGFLRGYPMSERITASMDRQIVNTYESLFSMLALGRIDIVLGLKRETERYLADHPQFTGIKRLEPPLMKLNLYHFVHRRHNDLIPSLTPVMEALLDDGLMDRLYAPYEEQNREK